MAIPRTLEGDERHFGFRCAAGTKIDSFERSGTLAYDTVFRGVRLPKGSAFNHDVDWHFLNVHVSAPTEAHRLPVAPGSVLESPPLFQSPGWIWDFLLLWPVVLARGLRDAARGSVTIRLSAGSVHAVGALRIELKEGDRVTCDHRGVQSVLLSGPRRIGNDELLTGHLGFDSSGRLAEVLLYRSQPFRRIPVFGSGLAGTGIRLFPGGGLDRFVLGEAAEIDGRRFDRGTEITLDRSGRLARARRLNVDVALYTPRPDVFAAAAGPRRPG
jgi:hypothetical protein